MPHTDIETADRDDLATTTLAEIYAQQGLYERALAIYERLAERAPDDRDVRARIAALSVEIERAGEGVEGGEPGQDPTKTEERKREAASPSGPETPEDVEFERWLESR